MGIPASFLKLGGATSTAAGVLPLLISVDPTGLLFSLLTCGLFGASIYEVADDRRKSRGLDELLKEAQQRLAPTIAGLNLAADEAALQAGLVPEFPEGDRRRPFGILFNLLIKVHRGLERRETFEQQAVELLKENDAFQQQVTAFLYAASSRLESLLADKTDHLALQIDFARDDLIELQHQLVAGFQQLSKSFEEQLQALRSPPLSLVIDSYDPATEQDRSWRFVYSKRRASLVGRVPELRELWKFLTSTAKPISWWLWTGAGGTGKSRLAYELALQARAAGWNSGLLRDSGEDPSYWRSWDPDRPTLVVVDYLERRAQRIGQIIGELQLHQHQLRFPVRFLLLERYWTEQSPWWKDFRNDAHAPLSAAIDQSRFAETRALPKLSDEEHWELIQSGFAERQKPAPDRTATLAALRRIDPLGRPLLTSMLADLLAGISDGSSRVWDATRLTDMILNREIANWSGGDVDEAHVNLLVWSTIRRGQALTEELDDLRKDGLELPTFQGHSRRQIELLCGLSGNFDSDQMPALEPDMIGELFVLNRLQGDLVVRYSNPSSAAQASKRLLETAWRLAPVATADFMRRALQNFPGHASAGIFVKPPDNVEVHRHWAIAATAVYATTNRRADVGLCDRLYHAFEQLSLTDGTGEAWWKSLARLNRGETHQEQGHFGEAFSDFNGVAEMEDAPVEHRAMAIFHRGTVYGQLNDSSREFADYSAALAIPGLEPKRRAAFLFRRGMAYSKQGRQLDAITDYTTVIEMDGVPRATLQVALAGRGRDRINLRQFDSAITDLTAAIEMPDGDMSMRSISLGMRASAYREQLNYAEAIADLTAQTEVPDVEPERRAIAFGTRGATLLMLGRTEEAIADYTTVIEMRHTDTASRAMALANRAEAYRQQNRTAEAGPAHQNLAVCRTLSR